MTIADAPPPYDTIVFDCDSTLSAIEGIEFLANAEQMEEIARLTEAAMSGEVALEDAFGRRLEIVRPTREALRSVARSYAEHALPNVGAVVRALRVLDKRVVVVSGGLLPAVGPFADALGVDETHAVDVRFDEAGSYVGFDTSSPLARSGGKIDILSELAKRPTTGRIAFIGDGATDLEAAHCAARFIGFGGVVRRANVFGAAAITCESRDFRDLLPLLLSPDEIERLRADTRFAPLVATD